MSKRVICFFNKFFLYFKFKIKVINISYIVLFVYLFKFYEMVLLVFVTLLFVLIFNVIYNINVFNVIKFDGIGFKISFIIMFMKI